MNQYDKKKLLKKLQRILKCPRLFERSESFSVMQKKDINLYECNSTDVMKDKGKDIQLDVQPEETFMIKAEGNSQSQNTILKMDIE